MQQGRFRLDSRKKFFSESGQAPQWAAQGGGCITIPGLDHQLILNGSPFKKCLDVVLRDMVSGQQVGGQLD